MLNRKHVRPTAYAVNRERNIRRHMVTVKDQTGKVIATVIRYEDPGEVETVVSELRF